MKKKRLHTAVCIISSSLLLTACGGSGSSSLILGSATPFTSWSDVVPPTTVKANGMSVESTYTAPAPSYMVTDVGTPKESQTASAILTYDSGGSLTKVTIQTPNTTLTWDKSAGDTIIDNSGVIGLSNPDDTQVGVAIAPLDWNWNYQTFGIWVSGYGTGSGTAGAFTAGAPTPGSDIPTSGNATFTGLTLGAYVDTDGTSYVTGSSLTVNADFLNRSLDFTTDNTMKSDPVNGNPVDASDLNMSGTLNYSYGTNLISGNVTATGMSGTVKGRFYGPHADEMGGHFSLSGSGVESYIGGFGAKQ